MDRLENLVAELRRDSLVNPIAESENCTNSEESFGESCMSLGSAFGESCLSLGDSFRESCLALGGE